MLKSPISIQYDDKPKITRTREVLNIKSNNITQNVNSEVKSPDSKVTYVGVGKVL